MKFDVATRGDLLGAISDVVRAYPGERLLTVEHDGECPTLVGNDPRDCRCEIVTVEVTGA